MTYNAPVTYNNLNYIYQAILLHIKGDCFYMIIADTKNILDQEKIKKEGFAVVTDIIPDAILEMRYYSTFNFVGERIDSYEAPIAYLTKEATNALLGASNDLIKKGYRIKIYDAYRSKIAVNHFKRWAKDLDAVAMKKYFYPDKEKAELFAIGYVAERSSHSRGSAVDLTIVDMITGRDVDMGCGFDFFGEISHSDNIKGLTDEQINNRMILRKAMTDNGFKIHPKEWWHFTLINEPYPDTYFDFPIN